MVFLNRGAADMKNWFLFLTLQIMGFAHAATPPAISLEPPAGQSQLNQYAMQTIQGQCGKTGVKVSGIVEILNGVYTASIEESRLTLELGSQTAKFAEESGIFNDVNGITCVNTKIGKRLLFWSNCSGAACEGQMSFFVFDPATLKRIAPGKPNESCNAACASKALGGHKLPSQIAN